MQRDIDLKKNGTYHTNTYTLAITRAQQAHGPLVHEERMSSGHDCGSWITSSSHKKIAVESQIDRQIGGQGEEREVRLIAKNAMWVG